MSGHMCRPFAHNDMSALHAALPAPYAPGRVRYGQGGKEWRVLFDAESIHRMNGTVAPLRAILGTMNEVVLYGQRTLVVAGAYTMYLYVPGERGMVACSGWRTSARPVAHIRL
jgi:7-keto-8-aminopelargonate synthetase-like enzyme